MGAPARRRSEIDRHQPALPPTVDQLHTRELRIGDASVDLRVERHRDDVTVLVTRRDAAVEVELRE